MGERKLETECPRRSRGGTSRAASSVLPVPSIPSMTMYVPRSLTGRSLAVARRPPALSPGSSGSGLTKPSGAINPPRAAPWTRPETGGPAGR